MVLNLLNLPAPLVVRGPIRKCLSTNGYYGCRKNYHKMRNFPTLLARGREAKKIPYSGPNLYDQKKNRLYVLQDNKEANPDEGVSKL